jgi:hypothetical protein
LTVAICDCRIKHLFVGLVSISDETVQEFREFAEQDFQKENPQHMQTGTLSAEAQVKLKIIQQLMEPCNRATYSERLRDATLQLGKSVRTVQRLVKAWERHGLAALTESGRGDKGEHRIDPEWKDFITKTYREGNQGYFMLEAILTEST